MTTCSRGTISVFSHFIYLRRIKMKIYFNEVRYNYRPQRSWGKLIFSVTCVKNSVHRGGLPHCMLGYHRPVSRHPRDQTPPRPDTPPGPDTLLRPDPPGDTGNKRAVRLLLECNLVVLYLYAHHSREGNYFSQRIASRKVNFSK